MHPREPADRWVRFHSLPNAKRYPDTDEERAEMLRRHHAVLDRLGGGDQPALDDLLLAVADERLWNVVITGADGEWRYHPYDGGADVIARTTAERNALAAEFRDWLSARDDGL